MFRIYTIFFFLLGSYTALLSQQNRRPQINFEFYNILPLPDHEFLAVLTDDKDAPSRIKFARFNQDEQLVRDSLILLENRGVRGQLESVFMWKEKINVLHSVYYPGPQRNNLILTQYDPLTFAVDTAIVISEAYTPGRYRVPFGYSISPDSSKIQFYSWSYALPDDPAKVEIRVMDASLATLWEKRYLLPYNNERLFIYKSLVTDNGEAYLMAEYYHGKIGPYTSIQEDKVERFALLFDRNDPEALRYSIRLDNDPVIQNIRFVMDKNNNVIGAGFYSDSKLSNYSGIYSFRIDSQTRKYEKKAWPISKEAFDNAEPPNRPDFFPERGKKRFFDYYLNQLHVDDAGNLYLIAEQVSEVSYYLEYGDILVAKISANQKLDWFYTLPKRHKSLYQESIFSYGFTPTDSALYFIFNDSPENYKPDKRARYHLMYEGGPTANVLVKIVPNGRVDYRFLNKKFNLTLVPAKTFKLSDRAMIVYGQIVNESGLESGMLEIIPLNQN
jgi:hypothetical protein